MLRQIQRASMVRSYGSWAVYFLAAVCMMLASSCGGGGGGGGSSQPVQPAGVAGTWRIHEEINRAACGKPPTTDDYSVNVIQNGASITVTNSANNIFYGTVDGNKVSWNGTLYNGDGYVTITSMDLTASGDSLTGSVKWDFSNTNGGTTVCSGTTAITGTRTSVPAYTLTITANANGTVTKNPDQASYTSGTVVTLTAQPAAGYTFANWSGDLTGTTNPATVTMNANKTVTANFTPVPPNTYTLTGNATNGTITKNPNQASYTSGTVVTLTAQPAAGYTFANWSGDLTGTTNPATVTLNANKTITANFVPVPATYTLTVNATNGTVTKSPNQASYASGTTVTLTATPAAGYTFANWSGDLTGTTNPAIITMNSNKTVTANFTSSIIDLTLYSAKDSFLVYDSLTTSLNSTNFGSQVEIGVGNAYVYGPYVSTLQYNYGLVDFIIDPILGKTIISAKLRMYVSEYYPQWSYGNYKVNPIIANWGEYTVTYNIGVSYALTPYISASVFNSSYTEWDVTPIVSGWANGTIQTWGFLIRDMNPPLTDVYVWDQRTYYVSRQAVGQQAFWPRLIIRYQ